jgi:hypothetical protein
MNGLERMVEICEIMKLAALEKKDVELYKRMFGVIL